MEVLSCYFSKCIGFTVAVGVTQKENNVQRALAIDLVKVVEPQRKYVVVLFA